MNKVVKIIIIIVIAILVMVLTYFGLKKIYDSTKYDQRIHELLSDDKEIERKWLIKKEDIPYDLNDSNVQKFEIKQTYICFDPEMRVRDYNNGESFEFTIKNNMTVDGMIRDEINIDITKEQYDNLVIKQEGNTINKTRYQLYDDGQIIALDIFHGDLDGLAYMEIEFKTEDESNNYKEPNWVIKDVTSDINYKNGHLARYGIPEWILE